MAYRYEITHFKTGVLAMIVNVDDELIRDAMRYFDPQLSPSDLINEAITTLVRLQATKKLVALGGMTPEMKDIPR